MICASIQYKNLSQIFEILDSGDVEMAEIRLDRCTLNQEEIEELFSSSDVPLIATCRTEGLPAKTAESQLLTAIRAGAAYVDLEIEAPAMMSKRLRREAMECGTLLIRSFHDFEATDSPAALEALAQKCIHLGADIVKIVTTARSEADCVKVLSLYDKFPAANLVAFCMGEAGRESRIDCLAKGAPFSYAALDAGNESAPGQWPLKEMKERLYSSAKLIGTEKLESLMMPASKSFAQRAIIIAALADGESHLSGYSECADNRSAIAVARELGAEVVQNGDVLTVRGRRTRGLENKEFFVGESGFLTRMMIPIVAALGGGEVRIEGEKTLLGRPLTGARTMLGEFGVDLKNDGEEARVPLIVSGKLRPHDARISGKNGSQLVSGLLTVLPLLEEDMTLVLTEPKSIPYIYITLDILSKFGVRIQSEMEGGEEFMETQDWSLCDAITFKIKGKQSFKACDTSLEGDWSSAANFMVAGAVFGRAEIAGLDTKSLQADLSILDILTDAGASISQFEESGVIHVQRAALRAFEVDASNCPDLFPVISVLAAFCQGRSVIAGVGRLANKESDRAKAIVGMLSQMGVRCSIKGDKLMIEGQSLASRLLNGRLLNGGEYSSHHDHRMVMALKVASLGASSEIVIDDIECVGKSFPTFFEMFDKL